MSQPTVLLSGIVPILQAVENRLIARNVVPAANLVKWVVGRNAGPPAFDSNIDIVLWARGFTAPPIPSWQTGAGKAATKLTRRLDIVPRTRLLLDEPDRMKLWLSGTITDIGYLPTEEAVINALILWTPLDSQNNHLTACDLHLLAGSDPEKEGDGWGWGSVSFEIQYLLALTQTFA